VNTNTRIEDTVAFVSRRMPRLIGLSTREFQRPAVLLPFLAVAALVWFTMLGERDINHLWSEYRVYVMGAAVIVTLHASMIAALVVQRQRRRQAEADLRESEVRFRSMADALREADAEKQRQRETLAHVGRVATMGELTASLVHELNQPLAAILTNAEAGERLLGRDAPPLDQVRQILTDIRTDDKRAVEIIRGVRGFLRRHEITKSTIDLNETVEEILRLMRREAIARGVEMRFARPEKSVCVSGNRVQLQQVVMNLVLNGLEAMSAVPADERRITLQVDGTADGAATMVVADRGPGVPPDKLSRLFEPFYTTKKDGLGMGLSIARSIIEAHGGRISATNNPEAGATFCVTLPGALCSPRAV